METSLFGWAQKVLDIITLEEHLLKYDCKDY